MGKLFGSRERPRRCHPRKGFPGHQLVANAASVVEQHVASCEGDNPFRFWENVDDPLFLHPDIEARIG